MVPLLFPSRPGNTLPQRPLHYTREVPFVSCFTPFVTRLSAFFLLFFFFFSFCFCSKSPRCHEEQRFFAKPCGLRSPRFNYSSFDRAVAAAATQNFFPFPIRRSFPYDYKTPFGQSPPFLSSPCTACCIVRDFPRRVILKLPFVSQVTFFFFPWFFFSLWDLPNPIGLFKGADQRCRILCSISFTPIPTLSRVSGVKCTPLFSLTPTGSAPPRSIVWTTPTPSP